MTFGALVRSPVRFVYDAVPRARRVSPGPHPLGQCNAHLATEFRAIENRNSSPALPETTKTWACKRRVPIYEQFARNPETVSWSRIRNDSKKQWKHFSP